MNNDDADADKNDANNNEDQLLEPDVNDDDDDADNNIWKPPQPSPPRGRWWAFVSEKDPRSRNSPNFSFFSPSLLKSEAIWQIIFHHIVVDIPSG